jgi:hypothetical protein
MDSVKALLGKIEDNILNPLIALLFSLALLYFLFGVYEFIRGASDPEARKTGGNHILWGFIGLLIMFGVYGILKIVTNTLGVPAINP